MFKFIGAVICGMAAAFAVAYFTMRPAVQRTEDKEQTKKLLENAVEGAKSALVGLKNYFSSLFQSAPTTPPAQA